VAEIEAPLVELLEEVRPLARELAVVLVRQELAGLATSLNGAASSSPALATGTAVSGPENGREPQRRPAQPRSQRPSGRDRPVGNPDEQALRSKPLRVLRFVALPLLVGMALLAPIPSASTSDLARWRVVKSKSVSGQFAAASASATLRRPKGAAVRFLGRNVQAGRVMWACRKGG
jgi:hypothetical protein